VTVSDPDAVEAVVAALHQAECLRNARPGHRFTVGHFAAHKPGAKRFLAALNEGGRAVTTTSSDQA
jgi:hypothetical protein